MTIIDLIEDLAMLAASAYAAFQLALFIYRAAFDWLSSMDEPCGIDQYFKAAPHE